MTRANAASRGSATRSNVIAHDSSDASYLSTETQLRYKAQLTAQRDASQLPPVTQDRREAPLKRHLPHREGADDRDTDTGRRDGLHAVRFDDDVKRHKRNDAEPQPSLYQRARQGKRDSAADSAPSAAQRKQHRAERSACSSQDTNTGCSDEIDTQPDLASASSPQAHDENQIADTTEYQNSRIENRMADTSACAIVALDPIVRLHPRSRTAHVMSRPTELRAPW